MGSIDHLVCSHCDYSEHLFTGSGMRPPENPLDVADSYQRKRLRKRTDISHAALEAWASTLLYCPGCHSLHPRRWFVLHWPTGENYEPRFRCGRCRTPLTNCPEDSKGGPLHTGYRCPRCQQATLSLDPCAGVWD